MSTGEKIRLLYMFFFPLAFSLRLSPSLLRMYIYILRDFDEIYEEKFTLFFFFWHFEGNSHRRENVIHFLSERARVPCQYFIFSGFDSFTWGFKGILSIRSFIFNQGLAEFFKDTTHVLILLCDSIRGRKRILWRKVLYLFVSLNVILLHRSQSFEKCSSEEILKIHGNI